MVSVLWWTPSHISRLEELVTYWSSRKECQFWTLSHPCSKGKHNQCAFHWVTDDSALGFPFLSITPLLFFLPSPLADSFSFCGIELPQLFRLFQRNLGIANVEKIPPPEWLITLLCTMNGTSLASLYVYVCQLFVFLHYPFVAIKLVKCVV